jgi:multiple sugar transport system permease protein
MAHPNLARKSVLGRTVAYPADIASAVESVATTRRRAPRAPSFTLLLNLPALLVILALVGYPIVHSLWLSLHRYNLRRPNVFSFVGLQNYVTILSAPEFWAALRITLTFSALSLLLIVAVGMAVALLLNESFPGRGLVRTSVLVPWAIPSVVGGVMWQWLYDAKVGALNGLLLSLGLISEYRGWLSDSLDALLALVMAHVWNQAPVAIIVLLAALQTVPRELYEAARIDGAGPWRLFRHVTLPWLYHALLLVVIIETMQAFRVFDLVYVLTAGGPGTSTTTLSWLTYQITFGSLDFGVGNAYSYTLSLITLALALLYFRLLYARGEFER